MKLLMKDDPAVGSSLYLDIRTDKEGNPKKSLRPSLYPTPTLQIVGRLGKPSLPGIGTPAA
jgi:hypothetical protein